MNQIDSSLMTYFNYFWSVPQARYVLQVAWFIRSLVISSKTYSTAQPAFKQQPITPSVRYRPDRSMLQ